MADKVSYKECDRCKMSTQDYGKYTFNGKIKYICSRCQVDLIEWLDYARFSEAFIKMEDDLK